MRPHGGHAGGLVRESASGHRDLKAYTVAAGSDRRAVVEIGIDRASNAPREEHRHRIEACA